MDDFIIAAVWASLGLFVGSLAGHGIGYGKGWRHRIDFERWAAKRDITINNDHKS